MSKKNLNVLPELCTMNISDMLDNWNMISQMLREKYLANHTVPITQGNGKDRRWTTRVPDSTKKDGRRIIRKATKEEVENEVIQFYMSLEKRVPKIDSSVTISAYFLHWIEYKKNNKTLASETFRRYNNDYRRFIKNSDFGQMQVVKVDYIDIEQFLTFQIERLNLKRKAVVTLAGYLKGLFSLAFRERLLSESPYLRVDLQNNVFPFCNRSEKADHERILSNEEIVSLSNRIHEHQSDYPLYMPDWAIEICMWTGLRVGEVVALRWNDIDSGEFHITHSEHRILNEDGPDIYVIGDTKNHKDRRVPIGKELSKILAKIHQLQVDNGIKSEYIIANMKGRLNAPSVSNAAYRRGIEAGITSCSIHAIRRTVSSLLNKVYDRATVSHIMGHTEEVNQKHYDYDTIIIKQKQDTMDNLYVI